jgi:hypothetical protein
MADNAAAFVRALEVPEVDVLGFVLRPTLASTSKTVAIGLDTDAGRYAVVLAGGKHRWVLAVTTCLRWSPILVETGTTGSSNRSRATTRVRRNDIPRWPWLLPLRFGRPRADVGDSTPTERSIAVRGRTWRWRGAKRR